MKRDAGADGDMLDNSRRPDQTPVAQVPNGHTAINHNRPPSVHTSEYRYPSEHKPYSAHRQDRRLYPSGSLQHHHQHASTRFDTTLPKDPESADSWQRYPAPRERKSDNCSPGCLVGADCSFMRSVLVSQLSGILIDSLLSTSSAVDQAFQKILWLSIEFEYHRLT